MKKILLFLLIISFQTSFSQLRYDFGPSFDYDVKGENNPEFVLTDNYNTYLLTTMNVYGGMVQTYKMIVRKFDQKNKLTGTYIQDFPKFDIGTLHNVLGTSVSNTGKASVFVESYSNKSKKTELSMLVFDKKTNAITTTTLLNYPILSASKAANVGMEKSQNGNFIALRIVKYRAKDQPELTTVMVLDAHSLEVVWQKEISFDDAFITESHSVSNSGKVVLVRSAKDFKVDTYLTVVTKDGQENKTFEEPLKLQQTKIITIGTQDYLLGFNYTKKGSHNTDFDKLLFYDIDQGKTFHNTNISEFANFKKLRSVDFKNIIVMSNEIHLFTQTKTEIEVKNPDGTMNSQAFFDPKFRYQVANVFVLGIDGSVKSIVKLPTDTTSQISVSDAFGLLNIKGTNYVNTGNFNSFFALNNDFTKNANATYSFYNNNDEERSSFTYVNQLVTYIADSNRLVFARTIGDDKMSLVNMMNMK